MSRQIAELEDPHTTVARAERGSERGLTYCIHTCIAETIPVFAKVIEKLSSATDGSCHRLKDMVTQNSHI